MIRKKKYGIGGISDKEALPYSRDSNYRASTTYGPNWDNILTSQVLMSGLTAISNASENSRENAVLRFNQQQFNPLNYLPQTANISHQALYGMGEGGEFDDQEDLDAYNLIFGEDTPTPTPSDPIKESEKAIDDTFETPMNFYNPRTTSRWQMPSLDSPIEESSFHIKTKGSQVNLDLVPGMKQALSSLSNMFPGLVVTSGKDSKHMEGSRHYEGKAIDIGANSSDRKAYEAFKNFINTPEGSKFKQQYGLEDIIDEGNHVHLELPKWDKGGIHIKSENRGKFTAYKKRTGKTTEEALHSKDPHVRQMANFAKNAKKWHHEEGGYVEGQEYDLDPREVQALIDQGYEIESFDKGGKVERMIPTPEDKANHSEETYNPNIDYSKKKIVADKNLRDRRQYQATHPTTYFKAAPIQTLKEQEANAKKLTQLQEEFVDQSSGNYSLVNGRIVANPKRQAFNNFTEKVAESPIGKAIEYTGYIDTGIGLGKWATKAAPVVERSALKADEFLDKYIETSYNDYGEKQSSIHAGKFADFLKRNPDIDINKIKDSGFRNIAIELRDMGELLNEGDDFARYRWNSKSPTTIDNLRFAAKDIIDRFINDPLSKVIEKGKEVYHTSFPISDINKINMNNYKYYIDKSFAEFGANNSGAYSFKAPLDKYFAKFEDSKRLSQYFNGYDQFNFANEMKDLPSKENIAKVIKQLDKGKDRMLLMNKVEGIPLDELTHSQVRKIPDTAYEQFFNDAKEIKKKGFGVDFMGNNILYNPTKKEFSMFDLSPQKLANQRWKEDVMAGVTSDRSPEDAAKALQIAIRDKMFESIDNQLWSLPSSIRSNPRLQKVIKGTTEKVLDNMSQAFDRVNPYKEGGTYNISRKELQNLINQGYKFDLI